MTSTQLHWSNFWRTIVIGNIFSFPKPTLGLFLTTYKSRCIHETCFSTLPISMAIGMGEPNACFLRNSSKIFIPLHLEYLLFKLRSRKIPILGLISFLRNCIKFLENLWWATLSQFQSQIHLPFYLSKMHIRDWSLLHSSTDEKKRIKLSCSVCVFYYFAWTWHLNVYCVSLKGRCISSRYLYPQLIN